MTRPTATPTVRSAFEDPYRSSGPTTADTTDGPESVTTVAVSSPSRTLAPRWARRAAWLTVLTTVPSALWRLAMAVGVPVGVDENYRREMYEFPSWRTAYVFGLTVLLVGLASLTLGLVQRWGEVTPRWMPWIGGRRVPPLAAVVPAGAGALALTLLWASVFSNMEGIFVVFGLEGAERIVLVACYAPLLLWGPLLAAVTVSYARRRRHGAPPPSRHVCPG